VNSHIYSIYLLVQYKSQSLIEHIRKHWVLSPVMRDHFVAVVPPQMRMGAEWFQGTADAVFRAPRARRRGLILRGHRHGR
jgi:glucose-1-phosphate adenylyltransferase